MTKSMRRSPDSSCEMPAHLYNVLYHREEQ